MNSLNIFFKGSVLGLVALATLAGCGHSDSGEPPAEAPIGNIQIDAYITQGHRNQLAQAAQYLDSLQSLPQNTSLSTITGLRDLNSTDLHQWLEARVQYILASNFSVENRGFYSSNPYDYENPDEFPDSSSPGFSATSEISVLMANLGSGLYLQGKRKHALIGLKISGVGTALIKSPRTGVLMLGENILPSENRTLTDAYRIYVLGVLFHEARHSDGHGKTLGFTHVKCPSGRYEGYYACDRNLNGPYSLEAEFLKTLMANCSSCNADQIEALKIMAADRRSRILKTAIVNGNEEPSTVWDDRPEGQR